jgi:hypothetical protein
MLVHAGLHGFSCLPAPARLALAGPDRFCVHLYRRWSFLLDLTGSRFYPLLLDSVDFHSRLHRRWSFSPDLTGFQVYLHRRWSLLPDLTGFHPRLHQRPSFVLPFFTPCTRVVLFLDKLSVKFFFFPFFLRRAVFSFSKIIFRINFFNFI